MDEINKVRERMGVVDHKIETTYADGRTPYTYVVSHTKVMNEKCPLCQKVKAHMEILATNLTGEKEPD